MLTNRSYGNELDNNFYPKYIEKVHTDSFFGGFIQIDSTIFKQEKEKLINGNFSYKISDSTRNIWGFNMGFGYSGLSLGLRLTFYRRITAEIFCGTIILAYNYGFGFSFHLKKDSPLCISANVSKYQSFSNTNMVLLSPNITYYPLKRNKVLLYGKVGPAIVVNTNGYRKEAILPFLELGISINL